MISPHLHSALAQARVDDLRRAADRHRVARFASPCPRLAPAAERSVTLRFGSPADRHGIARLAELDGSGAPAHPVLVAEVHGQLLAALALSEGSVVANPFHRTADLIDLLRARARQLDGGRRPRRSLRWRPWSRRVVAARRWQRTEGDNEGRGEAPDRRRVATLLVSAHLQTATENRTAASGRPTTAQVEYTNDRQQQPTDATLRRL